MLFNKEGEFYLVNVALHRDLSFGKGSTAPLKNAKLPEVNSVEKWDGKDGVVSSWRQSNVETLKVIGLTLTQYSHLYFNLVVNMAVLKIVKVFF